MRALFISVLSFYLMAMPSFAGSGSGNVSSVVNAGGAYNSAVPGFVFPVGTFSVANQRTLVASTNSSTNGNYMAFGSLNSPGTTTAQYQVSAGKTLYCPGFYYSTSTSGGGNYTNFGYGTAALAAHDTGTAPTGSVQYGATATIGESLRLFGGNNSPQWYPIPISFPASSYPYFRTGANAEVIDIKMICYEQ